MAFVKPRRRLPRAEREELMLDAAYRAFTATGYDLVSMEEVAAGAGVTKPMLYSYFGSKEGLYAAAVGRGLVDPLLAYVDGAVRCADSAEQQLWAGICAQLRFIDEHRSEWRLFVRQAPARGGAPGLALIEGRRRVTALLAKLNRQALEADGALVPPDKELSAQAHALQGAVEQITVWWDEHPEEALEAVALRVMNFAWQGFDEMVRGRFWLPAQAEPGGAEH